MAMGSKDWEWTDGCSVAWATPSLKILDLKGESPHHSLLPKGEYKRKSGHSFESLKFVLEGDASDGIKTRFHELVENSSEFPKSLLRRYVRTCCNLGTLVDWTAESDSSVTVLLEEAFLLCNCLQRTENPDANRITVFPPSLYHRVVRLTN